MDNVDEVLEELGEESAKLAEQCYIEGDAIVLSVGSEYVIKLDRCSTPEALLEWVFHLTEKMWMTIPLMGRFVDLAAGHHAIDLHQGV